MWSALLCLSTGLVFAFGGDSAATQKLRGERLQKLDANKTVRVDELLGAFDGQLCILPPYASAVSLSGIQGQLINAYLKKNDVLILEDEWGLVIVDRDDIRLLRIKRSAQSDILSAGAALSSKVLDARPEYEPLDCVSSQDALLTKVSFRGRNYLVLGQMRR
ncbi:hypothetical protein SB18R_01925 [Pseudomonas oryzihabitans]|nr:hypothetical protein SB18R_01925 [Pseudomonas psychrotolerans]